MADLAALKALIETGARYDAAVVSGNNGLCVQLLNETVPAGPVADRVWNDIPVADFFEALGAVVLPAAAEERIRTFAATTGVVPTSRAAVRTWLQANVADATARQNLRALAEREKTFAEAANIGARVSLNDVRVVVRQIAKSHIVATGQI